VYPGQLDAEVAVGRRQQAQVGPETHDFFRDALKLMAKTAQFRAAETAAAQVLMVE
jgi:hypothetical protein